MDNSIDPVNRRVRSEREAVQAGQNGIPLPPSYPNPNPAAAVEARSTYANYGDASVDKVKKTYTDESGNVVEREEQVFDDSYTRRLNILDRTTQIIYFLVGALEVLLLLRFSFNLLGADPNNGLVSFIYALSSPFVIAFKGIFSNYNLNNNSIFEISALIAMVIYALLSWGLVSLLDAVFRPHPSSRQTFSSTHRRS
ncbi:MAG: YggT family protein [Chloroflexota bacterium]|nr:YggT family protein [Chloroflexota bacterium]